MERAHAEEPRTEPAAEHGAAADAGAEAEEVLPPKTHKLAAKLRAMSPSKQATVLELWPGIECQTPLGLTVYARSKKEFKRLTGDRDREMIEWIRGFEPGEVLYDIGANCGYLTLAAAAIHRERVTVVAFEPGFASFESLARNLSGNGLLRHAIPLQVALLDRTGLEQLHYYGSTDAGTSLHGVGEAVDHEGRAFTPVETQLVPTFKLDDLVATLELPAPTRVKIDIDGHEERMLRGARRTLAARTIREIVVEIVDHDRAGTRLETITELLADCGYGYAGTFVHAEGGFVADHLFRLEAA